MGATSLISALGVEKVRSSNEAPTPPGVADCKERIIALAVSHPECFRAFFPHLLENDAFLKELPGLHEFRQARREQLVAKRKEDFEKTAQNLGRSVQRMVKTRARKHMEAMLVTHRLVNRGGVAPSGTGVPPSDPMHGLLKLDEALFAKVVSYC
mmetsp:Transcript_33790/g.77547  ORF Transcript_33790/g.77547 Transcript_33790/m.77547 type:complete len:154 (-) Transcript_33790:33-494(-)